MEENSKVPQSAVFGGGGALGAGVLAALFMPGRHKWLFIGILLALVVVLLGGYLLWVWLKRRRQSARMSGEMHQHSTASPRGISDPAKRARLDDLRKKFAALQFGNHTFLWYDKNGDGTPQAAEVQFLEQFFQFALLPGLGGRFALGMEAAGTVIDVVRPVTCTVRCWAVAAAVAAGSVRPTRRNSTCR